MVTRGRNYLCWRAKPRFRMAFCIAVSVSGGFGIVYFLLVFKEEAIMHGRKSTTVVCSLMVLIHTILLDGLLLSLSYKLSREPGTGEMRHACVFSLVKTDWRQGPKVQWQLRFQPHINIWSQNHALLNPIPTMQTSEHVVTSTMVFIYRMLNVSMGHASLWTKAKETTAQSNYVSLQWEIWKTFLMQNLF